LKRNKAVKIRFHPVLLPLLLGLAACAAEYSKSEAPTALRVDGAQSRQEIVFAAGSAALTPGEVRKINDWVLSGGIRPADRVAIAAAGPPALAEARTRTISQALLRWGIVATPQRFADVAANRAVVNVGRYAVTLPTCPNWSQSLQWEFTNAYSSNYGCADATNLGLMVASPGDLVSGRQFTGIDAVPAVNAIDRYLTDKITPPPQPTASPFAATTGGAPGGAGAGVGAGAGGASAGP
jgi:pilus assembly protein CpaD